MAARYEVTRKYAQAYADAPKKGKSVILDQVVELAGWNRDHARQQLRARLRQPKGRAAVIDRRKMRGCKYSYDARVVLQKVWAVSGGSCGQYLAPAMKGWLDLMDAEGSLVFGQDRYSSKVRAELLAMSAATIDRYLAPVKASSPIRGKTTTRSGSLLQTSITTRSGRRRGGHRARFLRGRYPRPLRSLVGGRVHPQRELHLRAHRLGVHLLNPQQRPRPCPGRFRPVRRADPLRRHRNRLR